MNITDLEEKSSGAGTGVFPKGASAGELADIIFFGFVQNSKIIGGRTWTTPKNETKLLKELQILPIQQEYERAMALLSAVLGSKVIVLQVTEDGAINFSTKHTTVSENGQALGKSECIVPLW